MKTAELISSNYVEVSGKRYTKVMSVDNNGKILYKNPIPSKTQNLQKQLVSHVTYDPNYTCSKNAIERHKNANASVLNKQFQMIRNKPKELREFMEVANKCISALL